MLEGFADTLRRMAAEIVAAQDRREVQLRGHLQGRRGSLAAGRRADCRDRRAGAGGGLAPIAITAQQIPFPGAAAAVGEVAGESAAAAAFTAAGTAAAAALTAAGTTAAAAFTRPGPRRRRRS